MGHEIKETDSMFSVREVPWHGLGTVLAEHPLTSAEAMREAGLDWEVYTTPLYIESQAKGKKLIQASNDFRAVVRDRDESVLGVVGKNYHPVQNAEAFEFMDAAAGANMVEYHTAGSLKNGRWVWVLAKLPGLIKILPKDEVEKYLLLYQAHDGSMAVRIGLTPIRVVCWNTLSMAHRGVEEGKDRIATIRHTMNATQFLKDAATAISKAEVVFKDAAEGWRFIAKAKLSAGRFTEYVSTLFPFPSPKTDGTIPKDAFKAIRERIKELHESGAGADIKGVRGSYWGAYNAVTEVIDHERGKNPDTRLRSQWFGNGAQIKQRAMNLAMAMSSN